MLYEEAVLKTLSVEQQQVKVLTHKIEVLMDKAIDKGRYTALVGVNDFSPKVVRLVMDMVKARGLHVTYSDINYSDINVRTLTIDWEPGVYSRFQAWLDKINHKVGGWIKWRINT